MEEVKRVKKPILNYINVFRGLAILLILAGHTMQMGEAGSWLNCISKEIWAGGTVLFVFIAGFLFEYLAYKFEYKNYLSKKWTNVILPYIITAVPGIILCFMLPTIYGNPFADYNKLAQIGVFLTTGRVHNVPAWFIPMIVIFFILSAWLLNAEKRGYLYKILPFALLITVIFPRQDIEPYMVADMDFWGKYGAYLMYVLHGFVHFFSSYVGGMYLAANIDKVDKMYNYRHWLLWGTILVSVIDIVLAHYYGISNGSVSKTVFTVWALVMLKHYNSFFDEHPKINKFMDVCAKYSFGLFFVHWYFVFLFNDLTQIPPVVVNLPFHQASFVVITRYLFVFACSFVTLWGIKKFLQFIGQENTRKFIGV